MGNCIDTPKIDPAVHHETARRLQELEEKHKALEKSYDESLALNIKQNETYVRELAAMENRIRIATTMQQHQMIEREITQHQMIDREIKQHQIVEHGLRQHQIVERELKQPDTVLGMLQQAANVNIDKIHDLIGMNDDDLTSIEETDYTGLTTIVRITNAYDGDTFDIVFWDPFMKRYNRKRCRLYGIDAPEKRPLRSTKNRNRVIGSAIEARNILEIWSNNPRCIYICTIHEKREKYGRLLVDVCRYDMSNTKFSVDTICKMNNDDFEDIIDISDDLGKHMLANTNSVPYFGGTKGHE